MPPSGRSCPCHRGICLRHITITITRIPSTSSHHAAAADNGLQWQLITFVRFISVESNTTRQTVVTYARENGSPSLRSQSCPALVWKADRTERRPPCILRLLL